MEKSRLSSNLISFFIMALTLSSLIAAFYSQFRVRTMQSELEFEIPTVDIKKRTEELNRRIEEHLQRIIEKAPERVEAAAIDQKLKDLENKITIVQQQTLGLRQAINPSKPEEILTIARLTDETKMLRKDTEGFQITMGAQQKLFQDSVLREITSSSASTNLI